MRNALQLFTSVKGIIPGFLALFGVPHGAITYSHGFEHALQTKGGIEQLQRWSQETLDQYQHGLYTFGLNSLSEKDDGNNILTIVVEAAKDTVRLSNVRLKFMIRK